MGFQDIWTSLFLVVVPLLISNSFAMSPKEKMELKLEAKDMFYHGFNAYMDNAFPADELMPLSCRGRFRGLEPDRGDIDDAMGNFSLTLIDSLDTIFLLGDLDEFEIGVLKVINTVTFDHDISVSVFETNIRVVGGLISSHILAELVKDKFYQMKWYQGELLNMALDVGNRLLPAFNSSTGLPHPRVNLRHGIKPGKVRQVGETCTACAGTMILEFAALSRLSGEFVFEEKASAAMDVLWSARNRMSNLVGNVLSINTGDWIRRDSGVGAGIDSYYEYVAKAYILLGEDKYLTRWETHYAAVMKYLSSDSMPGLLQDVHMHRPSSYSKHFLDSLAAFWPGLQVLMGDVKPAIEAHEILLQIMDRHNFIPEAFTADFQVHWGQYFLRPEFVESTYMLYKATQDPHYLEVGKKVLKAIQSHTRTTCGYATIKDVRTLQKEDRMDSFVLAETFKYLYLLFAEDADLPVEIDDFVFTTEAHLLPLSLARLSNITRVPLPERKSEDMQQSIYDEDVELAWSCPSTVYLFPEKSPKQYASEIREPLANMVTDKCPLRSTLTTRRITGSEFQPTNPDHIKLLLEMGLSVVSLPEGGIQLLHTAGNAKSPEDAEEGLLFMQEIIEISKTSITDVQPRVVTFYNNEEKRMEKIYAGPAQFGKELSNGYKAKGKAVVASPYKACGDLENGKEFWGKIGIVERGDCMFIEKARLLESLGAVGGIVIDANDGSTSKASPLFGMTGDKGKSDDVSIPLVFLFNEDAKPLLQAIRNYPDMEVTLQEYIDNGDKKDSSSPIDMNFDFAGPVKSFLEKSKKQVQKYFSTINKSSSNIQKGQVEEEEDEDEKYFLKHDEPAIDDDVRKLELDEDSISAEEDELKSLPDSPHEGDVSVLKDVFRMADDEIRNLIGNSPCCRSPERFINNILNIPIKYLFGRFYAMTAIHGGKYALSQSLHYIDMGISPTDGEKSIGKSEEKETLILLASKAFHETLYPCYKDLLTKESEEQIKFSHLLTPFRTYLISIKGIIDSIRVTSPTLLVSQLREISFQGQRNKDEL
ncbi:ER degradation-enhancing alpha-mannosidase-like protein 3 [Lepeophtheirus salmonis]|uniref:ER degradation-enhancing alpha-mannosidase-like protein 3 n=1 Tax=Lepeophtheirus salmonis TaxID=72036 RepID=UPI001AE81827|nr:ER degradation-enhancing alpha-mannosidase-like protein 3 [Lepeophtheirus salmonis]